MTDYYDGPRQGIANFHGLPHFYDCIFVDDYTNLYQLTPVSEETFHLAMEDWVIWERWNRAFRAGEVAEEFHPALPADHDRHMHLQSLLRERIKTDNERCVIRVGAFASASTAAPTKGILVNLVVRWSEPDGGSNSIWAD